MSMSLVAILGSFLSCFLPFGEYAYAVWCMSVQKSDIKIIENVQKELQN